MCAQGFVFVSVLCVHAAGLGVCSLSSGSQGGLLCEVVINQLLFFSERKLSLLGFGLGAVEEVGFGYRQLPCPPPGLHIYYR